MSKPEPGRYRTTNWSAYNAALRKRGSLLIWLDKEMAWHAPHEGRPGRPPVFSNAAIQFCLSIKGGGRLGNMPVACFSLERAEPRACSNSRSGNPQGWSPACCGWPGWTGPCRTRVRIHNQNMTTAAKAHADRKTFGQLS